MATVEAEAKRVGRLEADLAAQSDALGRLAGEIEALEAQRAGAAADGDAKRLATIKAKLADLAGERADLEAAVPELRRRLDVAREDLARAQREAAFDQVLKLAAERTAAQEAVEVARQALEQAEELAADLERRTIAAAPSDLTRATVLGLGDRVARLVRMIEAERDPPPPAEPWDAAAAVAARDAQEEARTQNLVKNFRRLGSKPLGSGGAFVRSAMVPDPLDAA